MIIAACKNLEKKLNDDNTSTASARSKIMLLKKLTDDTAFTTSERCVWCSKKNKWCFCFVQGPYGAQKKRWY